MDRFGVWSPHRDSHSVRAFKAALSLRAERWQWHDDMRQASWWVVDGTQATPGSLTSVLHQQKKNGAIQAAILAPSWLHIEDPVWTFFKAPLNVKLVYGWIDGCLLQQLLPPAGLAGQQLRLKRWPNLPRYTADGPAADGVHLTLACARLLQDWTSYEEAMAIARNSPLMDRLLADARQDSILESQPATLAAAPPSSLMPFAPETRSGGDPWSLVKRLLSKFS